MPRINSKQVEMACLGTVQKRTDGIIEEWRVQIASVRSRSRRRSITSIESYKSNI